MSITVIIACCIVAFVLGIAFLYVVLKLSVLHNNKKKKGGTTDSAGEKKRIGTMDMILIVIAVVLLAFTVTMIILYINTGAVPDSLVTCVFAAFTSECGAMAWIKTTKERRQERKWQLEDEERNKKHGND